MQKYILKKYLPRANAGETVIITNANSNTAGVVKINLWNEDETKRPRLAYIQYKDLKNWLEEIQEKPKSVWELKKGDTYYLLNNDTSIDEEKYCGASYEYSKRYQGNIFLNYEEAEQERNIRAAVTRIHKFCWENGIDNSFKSNTQKDNFLYAFADGILSYGYGGKNGNRIGYFSKDDAQKIIDNCQDDLKIIFGLQ